MKNTAANAINYTGIVTLSRYIGSKKVKIAQIQNAGGLALFSFLSDCLAGDFDFAQLNRPTKIKLLKRTLDPASNQYNYASSSGFIHLLSKPEKIYNTSGSLEGPKSTVRYSFHISRDQLESIDFNSIGLYTSNASDLDIENWAAIVHLSDEDRAIVGAQNSTVTSALLLDWELNFYNQPDAIKR